MILPFPRFRPVPDLVGLWFHQANAANYGDDKKYWFYPFKSRFLEVHGVPDGTDLQVITLHCHSCFKGIWRSECGRYEEICYRCDGTGVYRVDRVLLARWILNGIVYHCPIRRLDEDEEFEGAREILTGIVKHEAIPAHIGLRSLSMLLLWYEPKRWFRWQRSRLREWWRQPYWQSRGLRRFLLEMWIAYQHDAGTDYDDEIPF